MRYFYAELLIPNYRMKAFLSYVLLAAAVLSVGSCGRDSSKRSAGAGGTGYRGLLLDRLDGAKGTLRVVRQHADRVDLSERSEILCDRYELL